MNKTVNPIKNADEIRFLLKDYTSKTPNFTAIKKSLSGRWPLHTHNYFEVEFVISGKGKQILNGVEFEMRAGNFCLVTTTDFHEHYFSENTEIINVSFDPSLLTQDVIRKLTSGIENKNYYLTCKDYDKFYALMHVLLSEYESTAEWRNSAILNVLNYIIIYFLRKLELSETKKTDLSEIADAITYLNVHFQESPTLKEVADYIHYNPSYFSQVFKKHTGVKYINYLNNLKINQAKRLLAGSDDSIINIGYMCGFNSTANFFLEFKKSTGISPYQYRKKGLTPFDEKNR